VWFVLSRTGGVFRAARRLSGVMWTSCVAVLVCSWTVECRAISLLLYAAGRGQRQVEAVRLLVSRGVAVDKRGPAGLTALGIAVECGREAAARELVRLGGSVDVVDWSGSTPSSVLRARGT
jgi:hypothetical protein